jgi:hypothetical protein
MKPLFQLHPDVYARMLEHLSNLVFTDRLGGIQDMGFYRDDLWLSDTAVIEYLSRRQGTWEIVLLFAHHRSPLKFISRRITSHACPRRARMMAMYMRRLAAKDQRGTLAVDMADLNLSLN